MRQRAPKERAPATPEDAAGALADALLAREAVRFRIMRGTAPDPLAGLRIDDAEVDRLVAELSGDGPVADERRMATMQAAVDRARDALDAALRSTTTLLTSIVVTARLDTPEAELLAFLVAVELDPSRQRLLAYVQDDVTKTRPMLATIRDLFGQAGLLAVASGGRLRRAALVAVDETAAWASQTVTLASPVTWALAGDSSPDPALPLDATPYETNSDAAGYGLVLVVGEDRVRRLDTAFNATAGSNFLVTSVPQTPAAWEAVVREATVAKLAVVLELDGDLSAEARWWLERADHLPWAISSRNEIPLDALPKRPWVERRAGESEASSSEWAEALGEDEVDHRGHRLSANQLRLVSTAIGGMEGDLNAAVRRLASGPLDKLAIHIRPRRGWDDLILTADRVEQLRELTARYRHRDTVFDEWGFPPFPSIGLVALFSGVSGTGKTLAAEVIAADLGLDLYKLDLSSVVSKYIGETEKNLEEVFSAASGGNLVLFFDEADSLFGKRSEVTDARDRYANIEVSYLLQRIEAYDGLVIMATNFQKNIDEAFLRRIHVGIDFALPEEAQREKIWRHAFPPGAPVKDLDFEFLAAQFKLSGGNITGAALHAAFLAADAGQPITMELVVQALKREFQKLGRLRTEAEFGRYASLVNGP